MLTAKEASTGARTGGGLRSGAQTLNGPRRRTVYGKTQADVLRRRKDERAQERDGIAPDAGRTTVGEYLGLWLEDSVRTSVKPVTYEGYRQLVRKHLIPSLGRNRLGELTPGKVRRLRGAKLAEGLSTRTVQLVLVVLRKSPAAPSGSPRPGTGHGRVQAGRQPPGVPVHDGNPPEPPQPH